MANIWRNIAGRLGARSNSSMSRVADRAVVPEEERFTIVEATVVTVVQGFVAISLVNYWFGLDRIGAEYMATHKELKRETKMKAERLARSRKD